MKTILKFGVLSLLFAFATLAHADSITLVSGAGSSTSHENGALEYLGSSELNADFVANHNTALVALTAPTTPSTGTMSSYVVSAGTTWNAPISGTNWVSNTSAAGPGCTGSACAANNFYYYQTTFTAVGGTTVYNGTFSAMADDTLEILLNGNLIMPFAIVGADSHCASGGTGGANGQPSCGTVYTISLNGFTLLAGTNTLTIIEAQTGLSGAGVDFKAEISEAPTPEPSSLLLLGTGLLGFAFVLFRRNKPAGLVLNS